MTEKFSRFTKRKDYLICVDSDGCAMNTMDRKHFCCFGPCMVDEWGLDQWREEILTRWYEINLYTMTRGVNRFQALAIALQEINETYCPVEDLDALVNWIRTGSELSNHALGRAIEETDSICLNKALSWSLAVNRAVAQLPEEERSPFEGARQALAYARRYADVAVVSDANLEAVLEEWDLNELLEYTDIVLAQEHGSKAFCIGELLKQGYAKHHVLMCGDAPEDLDAARINEVLYYPILVKHEKESWAEFAAEGLGHLLDGSYAGEYQQRKIDEFLGNLGG